VVSSLLTPSPLLLFDPHYEISGLAAKRRKRLKKGFEQERTSNGGSIQLRMAANERERTQKRIEIFHRSNTLDFRREPVMMASVHGVACE
jgi:hypothetical protein